MIEERWISFFSEGSRLIGNLFLPAGMQPGEQRPGIVLCHGFTGVRQLMLPDYARRFAEAGFIALIFDYRGFGESEGPKWRLLPLEQVDDIRNALTWLATQPEVDPQRMGLWGTSFGGAHVPYVAGIDTRVKAAVAQVGFDTGERFLLSVRSESERAELQRQLEEDRRLRVTRRTRPSDRSLRARVTQPPGEWVYRQGPPILSAHAVPALVADLGKNARIPAPRRGGQDHAAGLVADRR